MKSEILLDDAVEALRNKDKPRAREMLESAIQLDPQNDKAWLYMALAAKSRDQALACLERATQINPENDKAWEMLRRLEERPPMTQSIPQANMNKTQIASSLEDSQVSPVASGAVSATAGNAKKNSKKLFGVHPSFVIYLAGILTGIIATIVFQTAIGLLNLNTNNIVAQPSAARRSEIARHVARFDQGYGPIGAMCVALVLEPQSIPPEASKADYIDEEYQNLYWTARLTNKADNVWTVECAIDFMRVSAGGREKHTETMQFIYDVKEGYIYPQITQSWFRTFYSSFEWEDVLGQPRIYAPLN